MLRFLSSLKVCCPWLILHAAIGCEENTFLSLLSLTQTWALFRFNKGIMWSHSALFSHTFPVKSYHRGPVPFSSQSASKACSVLHSLHFCMCTNRWCCRSAESDSAGTELQNTSWLGRRTAVCADSTTSSSWQRDKLSSAFLLATPSLSACVCGQAQESKWHLFLSLSPPLSPFLHLNLLLGLSLAFLALKHSATSLLTQVQKKHYLCPSSCPTLSHLPPSFSF